MRVLRALWRRPELAQWNRLPQTIPALMDRFPLRMDYAVVVTDLLRLKPKIFRGGEISWQHLAASCAVPLVRPQQKIGGRRYSDGGLLNPLPVWAAVELGATHLGSMRDALSWKRENIERWLDQGYEDALAKNISIPNCLER